MSLMRPIARDGAAQEREILPGDIIAGGESALAGAITTAGAGTWTGAAIATGIIARSGPGAGYTDTTDTAANIVAALGGSAPGPDVVPGTSFRLLVTNTVAFALTFAAGAGVVAGNGTLNIAASTWREYLVTVLSKCPLQVINSNTTNASAAVTFVLPQNVSALPLQGSNGFAGGAISDLVGATVTGTGIAANTTVIGVTMGQGGVIGVTLSQNATATNNNVALTFQPTVKFDGLRSGTL